MGTSMDECRLQFCDECLQYQVHPMTRVCLDCGTDHSEDDTTE